jgi:hypothetical protein
MSYRHADPANFGGHTEYRVAMRLSNLLEKVSKSAPNIPAEEVMVYVSLERCCPRDEGMLFRPSPACRIMKVFDVHIGVPPSAEMEE